MLNEKALLEFVEPYYIGKDIMHNMWHIELVNKMVNKILSVSSYKVDDTGSLFSWVYLQR